MLDLRRLRCFAALADELHFGRAAQRLHVAQRPLTRQIGLLETDLEFPLFHRTSRTVQLTTAGARFLPFARDGAESGVGLERMGRPASRSSSRFLKVHGALRRYRERIWAVIDGGRELLRFMRRVTSSR